MSNNTVLESHIGIKNFLEEEGLNYERQFFNFIDEYTDNDVPYICVEIGKLLDDNGCLFLINDDDKKLYARLARVTLDKLFDPECSRISLDNVIPYGKVETYKVSAAYGLRPATVSEVNNGVEALIPEQVYPAGEETYRLLCLMYWALTGRSWYYRQAGFNLQYNKDTGKVETSITDMIKDCLDEYISMLKFVCDIDKYDKAIKIIKKFKRNGFKYAEYAKDEITEEISVKQLVKYIDEKFPRKSDDRDFRRAIALVIKTNVNNERLSPMEIAELRRTYKKFLSNKQNYEKKTVNEDAKAQCDILLKNRAILGVDHFVYKIVSTFQKHNYIVNPSEKQQRIIDEALEKIEAEQAKQAEKANKAAVISEDDIDKDLEENTVTSSENDDTEVQNVNEPNFFDDMDKMYDMLNSGLFGSEDE